MPKNRPTIPNILHDELIDNAMQEGEVIDKEPELIERLRAKFGWPDDGVEGFYNSCLEGISFFVQQGYVEAGSIRDAHEDLFCPWCGMLHSSTACDTKTRKHQNRREQ